MNNKFSRLWEEFESLWVLGAFRNNSGSSNNTRAYVVLVLTPHQSYLQAVHSTQIIQL